MPLTGALKKISGHSCPHCKKEYGDHSKKQFLRCLYTSDYNFYKLVTEFNNLQNEHDNLTKEDVSEDGGKEEK